MRLHLARPILGALLLGAGLACSALGAEPELAVGTASLRKQCIGYGYKAGTDALAECVMKLDLLRTGGQGSAPQVASPLPEKAPAPTPAAPVHEIVEPPVPTKPIPTATPTPASTPSPTPAAAAVETTAPEQPAAPRPATTAVQTTAPTKPADITATLAEPASTVVLGKATEVNQGRLAQVKSIALIAIKDPPVFRVSTRAATQLMWTGALCGVLCGVLVNEANGRPLTAEEMFITGQPWVRDAAEVLNEKAKGIRLGETSTNLLTRMMQENGYDMSRVIERAVPVQGPFDFYKGQNARSDAILHLVILRANYFDESDNYLRPAIDVTVTLAASKYGNILFKGVYTCPNTAKSDQFAFTNADLKHFRDHVGRATDGLAACMKEIATDVAATLKRPVAPPAQ